MEHSDCSQERETDLVTMCYGWTKLKAGKFGEFKSLNQSVDLRKFVLLIFNDVNKKKKGG